MYYISVRIFTFPPFVLFSFLSLSTSGNLINILFAVPLLPDLKMLKSKLTGTLMTAYWTTTSRLRSPPPFKISTLIFKPYWSVCAHINLEFPRSLNFFKFHALIFANITSIVHHSPTNANYLVVVVWAGLTTEAKQQTLSPTCLSEDTSVDGSLSELQESLRWQFR